MTQALVLVLRWGDLHYLLWSLRGPPKVPRHPAGWPLDDLSDDADL